MSERAATADAGWVPLYQDARVIALVGLAHMTSHFFHLIIAPLFSLAADRVRIFLRRVGAS